ncbi:unnamed protein product [Rotaria magnacalcarata]|uniref:Uncharacterized protein n=1 Tax=Rotaria magnacalcarata TaxID=392030 RepID=A0A819CKX1_9BILA|nr:unnamed protein product [Rotaria magnacalcarata]CAF2146861.1 unnamed protein product [Rotaria magnacalcarata]CAF3785041.1 unnamed protein product [Rotaria magnacalcarata]CAF3819782.1 unnamed protein product [Rotaria magnacalcarata]
MAQYLSFILKNDTTLLSQGIDENLFGEENDNIYDGDDLHYKIPFWIGAIVISLLLLSIIIATIRYCIYTLCSSHIETEKIALMPAKSPCSSSNVPIKIQRQTSKLPDRILYNLSDENDTSLSSIEQSQDQQSAITIIPINRHHSRRHLTSPRRHHKTDDVDHTKNDYFSPTQISTSQISIDFRKRINGIYVLPVSPTLSSSSSTINPDETKKFGSKTMPSRSGKIDSSSANIHHDFEFSGIQNNSFTDSPKSNDRILRFIEPPTQPPPLPPIISQTNLCHNNKSSSSSKQHSAAVDLKLNINTLPLNTFEENKMKKTSAPPVACRTRKPLQLSIGLDELTNQSNENNFRLTLEPSPQDDCSERTWPQPPESLTTSIISRPSSISYDHLIPTIIMHQNSTTNRFHRHQHDADMILTESET